MTEDEFNELFTIAEQPTPDSLGFPVKVKEPKPPKVKGDKRGRKPLDPNTLRTSQLRTLAVMSECEADSVVTAITFVDIVKKVKTTDQTIREGLGPVNLDNVERHDRKTGYRCLLSRGLVACSNLDGQCRYYLTQLGQQKVIDLEDEIAEVKRTAPRNGGVSNRTGPKAPKGVIVKKEPKFKRNVKRVKQDVTVESEPQPE